MKSSISMSNIALGFTIFICFSSCVTCSENERGAISQDILTSGSSSNAISSPEDLLPVKRGANERYFRNYYEMLRDAEPIWKRAPASGFFGMRGKKVPSSTFYGMRGKKGPSGFLGMRGKKSTLDDASKLMLTSNFRPGIEDLMLFGGGSGGLKLKGPVMGGKTGNLMDAYDDYSLFGVTGPSSLNRVPVLSSTLESSRLRGKRSARVYSVPGKPLNSYQ